MTQLNSKQRAGLRARAHALNPVVQIGHGGLSEGVLLQIDAALKAHELIKVKIGKDNQHTADELAPTITENTRASVVQRIGHTLVLFRRNPKKPKLSLKTRPATEQDETPGKRKSGRQLRRNRRARENPQRRR